MSSRRSASARSVAVLAAAGSLLTAAAVAAPTAALAASHHQPADTSGAAYGAGYLARAISAGGGHIESYGAPDVTDTAYAVLGLHAAGVGRTQERQAVAFLKTQLGDPLRNSDGTDNPGRLGYVILAAVADGQDPDRFGGHAAINDLPRRLLATERTSGSDAGLFGTTEDPTYDGAFRQGLALTALKASHVHASSLAAPIGWLETQQCANGLWESYRNDPTTACDAADPDTFAGPDTNSTAMAVQGLAAYGQRPDRDATVASLKAVRSSDGGFPFLAASGQDSDPDSTALVIQALLADRSGPGAAYAALAGFQLGCSDLAADRGAYFFPGTRSPNLLATVQAVPAAAGDTLPLAPSALTHAQPAPAC